MLVDWQEQRLYHAFIMASLQLHAGPVARRRLLEEGLHPQLFKAMVGASGGPKWFVLYGLDRYLFGDFFARSPAQLVTLGSSAGAWRMCCLATADPVAAIDRLATLYSQERYSAKPNSSEVTGQAEVMLANVLGPTGAAEIAANERFRTHIVTTRCRGISSADGKFKQGALLLASATCNAANRSTLDWFYERVVFHNMGDMTPWRMLSDLTTTFVPLSEDNVFKAMLASGSIPFVLEGVTGIAQAPAGLYWDGGIVDYHFDWPFSQTAEEADKQGLVLYPHFHPFVTPGWFDKHLPWRKAHAQNYDNVVLLAPTEEFVASLPNGKLSDRSDFENFDFEQRVANFRQVLERSHELAAELATLVQSGINDTQIQPIGNLSKQ